MADLSSLRHLPSVDQILKAPETAALLTTYGRATVTDGLRTLLDEIRTAMRSGAALPDADAILASLTAKLEYADHSNLRPLINLTGTVLHTNLGRALLAEEAVKAAVDAMREAAALEFDLDTGKRGERDSHLRELLCELTGAEDATIVNNNAAASTLR